ncbi:hypothetical protein [Viscerimonas tarda]
MEKFSNVYANTHTSDSIYIHDSTYIANKGDTVYLYKYRYMTAIKIQTDTLIRTDTIPRPYPVVKEVNGKTGLD